MMDLTEIYNNLADQEKGHEYDVMDPVTGQTTGIKFRVAGPDSQIARRARLKLVDDLSELSDEDGNISAENREKARLSSLASLVLDWNLSEAGQAVPCNSENIIRILKSVHWLQVQVDAFAADRSAYRGEK